MQMDADVNFQRRIWAAQRTGWLLIGIVILAALAGSFGSGPISRASAKDDRLEFQYERFARLQQPTQIHFSLGPQRSSQLAVSRRYVDAVHVEQIISEPSEVAATGEWLIYRFVGAGPISITFTVKPEQFGGLSGAAQVPGGGRSTVFHQFVYP